MFIVDLDVKISTSAQYLWQILIILHSEKWDHNKVWYVTTNETIIMFDMLPLWVCIWYDIAYECFSCNQVRYDVKLTAESLVKEN